jgi:hypothetical protein
MQSDNEEYESGSCVSQESHDRRRLVERAMRAELSAEVAVREARLAKQEAIKIKSEKQREIDELKVRLSVDLCLETVKQISLLIRKKYIVIE